MSLQTTQLLIPGKQTGFDAEICARQSLLKRKQPTGSRMGIGGCTMDMLEADLGGL